jgi:hypothetical protein
VFSGIIFNYEIPKLTLATSASPTALTTGFTLFARAYSRKVTLSVLTASVDAATVATFSETLVISAVAGGLSTFTFEIVETFLTVFAA